jgi:GntR family transcriptional regulator, transcriptional repressor for pyruvate dehydrogenase complex
MPLKDGLEKDADDATEAKNKTSFIRSFENLILSGRYTTGDRIPAERELSKSYHISRPIIHEGLLDLARKGFVTISPRRGTFVNDFRKLGSPEMLASLFAFSGGKLSAKMYDSLLEFRILFELEAVRKVVARKTDQDVRYLKGLMKEETELLESMAESPSAIHPAGAADLDFRFHQALMMASGNEVYPMLFNSFKKISLAILERHFADPGAVAPLFALHRELVKRIEANDEEAAVAAIREILMTSSVQSQGALEKPA